MVMCTIRREFVWVGWPDEPGPPPEAVTGGAHACGLRERTVAAGSKDLKPGLWVWERGFRYRVEGLGFKS